VANVGAGDVLREGSPRAFVLCNEAIVRAAIEADVKVISAYPGSPTTEILDTFSAVASAFDYKMEISANEKVALETCAGASMAGLRSFSSMKSVGLNVASDAFHSLSYTGVKGGMVIVVADDPQAHSSQSEQDGRMFAPSAYVPMLEPSDPTEAYSMVKEAFRISETHGVPVLLRTSTRVNHQSGIVQFEKIDRTPFSKVKWDHPPGRFITVADSARAFKKNILRRTEDLEKEFEVSDLNRIEEGRSDIGIITCGAGFNYARDACAVLGISPSVLKLGTTWPIPRRKVQEFLQNLSTVIVVEELSPYLESFVTAVAKEANPDVVVIGKRSGHFSEAFEYTTNSVVAAMARALDLRPPVDYDAILRRAEELKKELPPRSPTFCPGCPHRATLYALRQALKGVKHVVSTDIGCYSMSFLEPVSYGDSLLCMGASLGVAAGLQYAVEEKVVAIIGDSTFYHAGLPGLVNAAHHGDDFTIVVLDNQVTAMTGQQPHPGSTTGAGGRSTKPMVIENVVSALGIEDITIVDPYDVKVAAEAMRQALSRKGPNVIISRRACALHSDRQKRKRGEMIESNDVRKDVCKKPYTCIRTFHCPAIFIDDDDRKAAIDEELCDGCSVCARICPFGSIARREGGGQPGS